MPISIVSVKTYHISLGVTGKTKTACAVSVLNKIRARAHKDLAEQASDPWNRARHWLKAKEIYTASYDQTGGYWSGINAATMARLLGEEDAD